MISEKTRHQEIEKLTFSPVTAKDQDFLCRLYASTRQDEMDLLPWHKTEKNAFLKMQFEAQHQFYMSQFRKARFDLIRLNGKDIGRLYVDRRELEIRLNDIALLPQYRGRGFGTHFIKNILKEAFEKNLPVRLHVEHDNPCYRLYLRLGFEQIDENGVYHLMEWQQKNRTVAYKGNNAQSTQL